VPFQQNRFHYNWHWWYNFGTGDVGNDGTHEIDYARWGLGVDFLPSRVTGVGGKYFFDDDQEFPDTATMVFEFASVERDEGAVQDERPVADGAAGRPRQLIFEMRIWSTNYPYQIDNGAEFYGTKGRMVLSKRGKLEIFGERNERIEAKPPEMPELLGHQADFLYAIRTGRRPNADVEEAHRSVALVHLGNMAVRLNRSLQFDPHTEQIVGDEDASRLLTRPYRQGGHWAAPHGV
jgi:predicted dehydrogenase